VKDWLYVQCKRDTFSTLLAIWECLAGPARILYLDLY
jgi:hypothetical protein